MRRRKLWIIMVLAVASAAHAQKLTYEPISAEAAKLDRLKKYESIDTSQATLSLGKLELDVQVPTRCDAYDAVPIRYSLRGETGDNDRVAVEAVAFENESRRQGRDLYDLALPGNMKLDIEYLGSQTGVFDPRRVTRLTQTSRHETFPPYVLDPFVSSGTVKRGNYLFFKFRITNAGDTILDAEGFGGWMAWPEAKKEDGSYTTWTINQFPRHVEYLYPGESFEQWVHFLGRDQDLPHARTLPLGKFKIQYRAAYRQNTEYNWIANMWAGPIWTGLEVPIAVAEEAADTPLPQGKKLDFQPDSTDRMTRYIGSLEEFMTSFKIFERTDLKKTQAGTIHVQVAPWTQHIVVKLIGNRPGQIKTVAVPIDVSTDNLAIRHNPDNPFVVRTGNGLEPAFCTQNMAAMRATTQLGPCPEKHIPQRLREMMDCGVNVLCTTAGDWHQPQISDPNAFVGDIHAETFKHYYDVIAPQARIPVFGWGLFPPKTANVKATGQHYWGKKFDVPFNDTHYAYSEGKADLDVGHPDYPKLQAGAILFNYKHWGHQWYRTADGDVLIDVEDTWGWLRDDINVRYFLGKHSLRRFHSWLRQKYTTVDKLNEAWGTTYAHFNKIDPQANQDNEGKPFGNDLTRIAPVYTNKDNPFHDWTAAIDDWDTFRTELRCDVYRDILKYVRKDIPGAQINIRTEGGFIPVTIPEDTDVAHLRHSRYCQRRQALVSEVLQKRKVLKYHSDYTTIPYTESEWRFLLKQLREEGIRGVSAHQNHS